MNWLPRITELSKKVENCETGGFSAMQQLVAEVEAASSTYAEHSKSLVRDACATLLRIAELSSPRATSIQRSIHTEAVDGMERLALMHQEAKTSPEIGTVVQPLNCHTTEEYARIHGAMAVATRESAVVRLDGSNCPSHPGCGCMSRVGPGLCRRAVNDETVKVESSQGTPRAECIKECEAYLHGSGQGSICGLHKKAKEADRG